jgi:hypothetical protein
MSVLDLAFEWPVDEAGYSVDDLKPKRPKGRGGARLLDGPAGPHISRKGGPLRSTRPLELSPTLFMQFARLDGSDDSCVQFADAFGYLGLFPDQDTEDRVMAGGEPLVLWRNCIDGLRRNVEAWRDNPTAFVPVRDITITRLDASLVPIDGRAALRIRPRSLIGGIQLQFAQAVASGLDIRTCDHCGKIFETGGRGRTRKARFCSDRCRTDYHVARRKQT